MNLFTQIYFTFTITSDMFYNIPQIENKFMLAEAIVAYHVLIKRTPVLDNFAKGLATLDVLKALQENPSQFEEVFLANETLDGCVVMEMMKFHLSMKILNDKLYIKRKKSKVVVQWNPTLRTPA